MRWAVAADCLSNMRIASWNINSVRLRALSVVEMMKKLKPDVVCLQETKCPDELFPSEVFAKEGYVHQHYHGMKSYNVVAIFSKVPIVL